jgi:uncharacterized protein
MRDMRQALFDSRRIAGGPGTPVWVEMTTTDINRSKAFYKHLFGWSSRAHGSGQDGRVIFELDGKSVAGAHPGQREESSWLTYFRPVDPEKLAVRVETGGGKVLTSASNALGGVSAIISCDNLGAIFGVSQPGEGLGFERSYEPNTFIWAELNARNCDTAIPFYRAVFGWDTFEPPGGRYTDFLVDGAMIGATQEPPAGMPGDLRPQWVPYFKVVDYDTAATRVRELGGIVHSSGHYPGGQFAICADPTGAYFGVLTRTW